MDAIHRRLDEMEMSCALASQNQRRKTQVGSGMRGDKRRTYRFQEGLVYDSITGREARTKDVLKGEFDRLWG
jgi:protein subunit release factor A